MVSTPCIPEIAIPLLPEPHGVKDHIFRDQDTNKGIPSQVHQIIQPIISNPLGTKIIQVLFNLITDQDIIAPLDTMPRLQIHLIINDLFLQLLLTEIPVPVPTPSVLIMLNVSQ